jgi:hypothetical protein
VKNLSREPYQANKIPDHWPHSPKRIVTGKLVAISGLRLINRGTELMYPRSRALPKYSIVEITATDENQAAPGSEVNSVLYIGFFEVDQGGIVVSGESVSIGGVEIGHIAGFSGIHDPNHLNIIIRGNTSFVSKHMTDAADRSMVPLDFSLEESIRFE